MTENGAIKLGKALYENITNNANNIIPTKEYIEFIGIAIQALEEIQQYRAIGTVEDIYNMFEVLNRTISELHSEVDKYRAIGTIEEFKALKEKNEPMQLAEHNFQDEPHYYLCPVCRNIVSCTQNYCEECGQALEN